MKYVYQITDGIPFFIDRIFTNTIFEKTEPITKEVLDAVIQEILTNRKKNETLDHFYDRIKHYYKEKELAYALLDILSQKENHTISESELKSSHGLEGKTNRTVMETIDKLYKDNYLDRSIIDDERHFTFRYNLIRRWWKINNA